MPSPGRPLALAPLTTIVVPALAWSMAMACEPGTATVQSDASPDVEVAVEESNDEGPAYTLRYGFEKGHGLHYSVVQRTFLRTTKGELEDTTRSGTEIAKHLRVIHVDEDGTALLETSIDHARMAVQFDDAAPIEFDSRSNEDPPKQFRDLAAKVGRPLARLKVSSRGELLSLTKLERGKPKTPEPKLQRRKKDEGEAKDEKSDENVTENILVEFPEKPLHVGDSWQQTFEVDVVVAKNLKRKAKLQRTFTLDSVDEEGVATIRFEIVVLSIVRDPQISIQLLQMTPKGKIAFDTKAGYIVSRSQSSSEHIFGPFGPGSEMVARSQRSERFFEPKKPGEKRDVAAKE